MTKWELYEKLKAYYHRMGRVMPAPVFRKLAVGLSENDIHDVVMEFNTYLDSNRGMVS